MGLKQYFEQANQRFFRTVEIASNVADVTRIDESSEIDAEYAGLSSASVNTIWRAVENLYRTGTHPGIAFCLRKNGHIILNRTIGYAKGAQAEEGIAPVIMDTTTPICLYSASKAVMAMMVHKLAEDGHVRLLDPIAHYLPEFAQNGKQNMSIYQMLAHRGGFPSLASQVAPELLQDRERILQLIYQTQAKSPEGRIQAYHAVSSGFIADELVRVTTGKTIAEYLQETVSIPMGMKNFSYGLHAEQMPQAAKNYITGMRNGKMIESVLSRVFGVSIEAAIEHTNTPEFMQALVPSANVYSNAEEINRFYQMLLAKGQYQGKQIFQAKTIEKAIHEAGPAQLDKSLYLPMRFSAGFMLGGEPLGLYGLKTHNAFGHIGFANIFCWADPDRDIAVSLLTTGKPILGNHIVALPKLLHTISKECSA